MSEESGQAVARSLDKQKAAAVMLVNGVDIYTIARELDLTVEAAREAAEKALANIALDSWDKAALRRLVTARLEAQYRRVSARAADPKYRNRELAAKTELQITDRLIRLLGLDAEQKLNINHTATTQEIADMVNTVMGARALPEEVDVVDAEIVTDEEV